jgi:hypothetical protein
MLPARNVVYNLQYSQEVARLVEHVMIRTKLGSAKELPKCGGGFQIKLLEKYLAQHRKSRISLRFVPISKQPKAFRSLVICHICEKDTGRSNVVVVVLESDPMSSETSSRKNHQAPSLPISSSANKCHHR